jgi:hypothetical protein
MKEVIRILTVIKSCSDAVNKIVSQELANLEKNSVASEVEADIKAAKETKAPKGGKKAKEEMEEVESPYKETKADLADATDDLDDMFGDEKVEDTGPTLEDVRKIVKDFATKHGKEKALKLLGKFKVTSIPDIKKTDYAAVIELAKKHL